jgi:hypothetical protein
MIGLFFFLSGSLKVAPSPRPRGGGNLEPPRNILRQQADKETGPNVKGGMSRKNEAGGADKSRQDEGNSNI